MVIFLQMKVIDTNFQILFLEILQKTKSVDTLSLIEVDCTLPEERDSLFYLTQSVGRNLLNLSTDVECLDQVRK